MTKTNIQFVAFLFNLFKDTRFAQNFLPKNTTLVRNNSNLTMLTLTLSFVY